VEDKGVVGLLTGGNVGFLEELNVVFCFTVERLAVVG
jgi:hypothetical protein